MLIIYAIELVPLSVGIGLHLFHDIGYILCYSFLCPFLLLFEVWVKILIICKIIKYKYNDSTYNIKVNIGKEEKLIIDGKTQRSKNKIKLSDKRKTYEVSLYIKEKAND